METSAEPYRVNNGALGEIPQNGVLCIYTSFVRLPYSLLYSKYTLKGIWRRVAVITVWGSIERKEEKRKRDRPPAEFEDLPPHHSRRAPLHFPQTSSDNSGAKRTDPTLTLRPQLVVRRSTAVLRQFAIGMCLREHSLRICASARLATLSPSTASRWRPLESHNAQNYPRSLPSNPTPDSSVVRFEDITFIPQFIVSPLPDVRLWTLKAETKRIHTPP